MIVQLRSTLSLLLTLATALGTAPAAMAQPAKVLDLATDLLPEGGQMTRVHGSVGNGRRGVPVSGGLDVDGDGHVDVGVGYFQADRPERPLAGEVNLIFGNGGLGETLDTAQSSERVLRFLGEGSRETAGSEIWIDDVTGDGLGDLLICRQNYTPDMTRIGAGALTIVPGGSHLRTLAQSLAPIDLGMPPANLEHTTLIGAEELDRLGIWVRTGDVDGDGTADIVVGADQADLGAEENRGAVWVVRGGPHLVDAGDIDLALFNISSLAGNIARLMPPLGSDNYHLGATVFAADLDGNGRAEVLAAAALNRSGAGLLAEGAPSGSAQASGGAPDGRLYIAWDDCFPAEAWPASFNLVLDDAVAGCGLTVIQGASNLVTFGEEILAGLDYDNDGRADLFVGDLVADGTLAMNRPTSGVGYVLYDAASLRNQDFSLDSPPPGLRQTVILGPNNGAIGADTAAHGDFDGDSVDDLAFGSPHANPADRSSAGAVHILHGQPGGWPALIDLASESFPSADEVWITEIQGANGTVGMDTGDTLCYSAAAGDVDLDGRTDLIVNEMAGNGLAPGTEDVGNLLVISGTVMIGRSVFVDGFERGSLDDWGPTNLRRQAHSPPELPVVGVGWSHE